MISKSDIKLIKSLSDREERYASGLFVVEGRKMAEEALSSGFSVHRIFLTRDHDKAVPDGYVEARVPAEEISPAEMERISHLRTPPGILALVEIPVRALDPSVFASELVLFLDGVQDPGNMGTIVRIADWFGIGNVVCSSGSADCYNPKVVQATMGALFRVAVHYGVLPEILEAEVPKAVPVYGTLLEGEDIYSAGLSATGIVIMGSESHGISREVASLITRKLFIPPYPDGRAGSESLNVATAAAITCAEFRRRVRASFLSGK